MSSNFRDPQIPDGEKSVFTVSLAGRPGLFEAVIDIAHAEDRYVTVTEIVTADRALTMTVEQRFLRTDGSMRAESYKAETRSGEDVVSREEGYFLDTRHLQFGGEVLPFPTGAAPILGSGTLLRGMEFRKGAKADFDVWLAFSVHWPMVGKVEKQTTVEVPAGNIDCWQVKMRPSFTHINSLLDKVVSGVLPPFVAHFETKAPHRLVRMSFPTGPMPWNPRGTLELTS